MNTVNVAVIGTGYLGKFHAAKYAELEQANLVAICDRDVDTAGKIAKQCKTEAETDYTALLGKVDAVCIATPTASHFGIAKFFLSNGVHVMVEKPITTTLEEADTLIAIAKEKKLVLQVGHLERFNNAIKAIRPLLNKPRFIESSRLATFKMRSANINVILDLMIHDIDLIQSIIDSPIERISTTGANVLSPKLDIGNARIEFENGAVANVTASRISLKQQRKLRIFQADAYISLDLDKKKVKYYRKLNDVVFPEMPEIESKKSSFSAGDPIMEETKAFLDSIINGTEVVVPGEDGRRALATAIEITNIMRDNLKRLES